MVLSKMPTDICGKKNIIRKLIKSRWKCVSAEVHSKYKRMVLEEISQSPLFRDAGTILIYHADQFEIDLSGVLESFPEKRFGFPVIQEDMSMIFRLKTDDNFILGKYGIPVPPENNPEIPSEDVDLAFVPCQAIDSDNIRLGRGAGFYDRFLSKNGHLFPQITVVPFFSYYQHLPKEQTDIPVTHRIIIK